MVSSGTHTERFTSGPNENFGGWYFIISEIVTAYWVIFEKKERNQTIYDDLYENLINK